MTQKKAYDVSQQDALVALLGAGLGGAGGYGLYKYLTPEKSQSAGKGTAAAILGSLAGGGLGLAGSHEYSAARDAMKLEALNKQQAKEDKVQAKIKEIEAARKDKP